VDHRQLQLFLAIAERQNLSHAADALNMTQPGLSKSMNRLQQSIGEKLYHRRGRGIELTEAGRVLLKHVRLIETQFSEAKRELSSMASGAVGHVRVGAGPSWLSRHLPVAIARVSQAHPGTRFSVVTGFPEQLIGRLRQGELDFVLGAIPDDRLDPDFKFVRLTSDAIHVVGRKDHPLRSRKDRTLADYGTMQWVLPSRQELIRQRLIRVFKAAGLSEPTIAVETDSLSLILSVIRTTDFLGLTTSQILTQTEAQGIVSVDLGSLRFKRDAGIVSHRQGGLAATQRLMIAELRRIVSRAQVC
jgi:LysR family transcriptional regulator of gallate degradation